MAALNRLTVLYRSPIAVKSTATAFGSCCRSAMHCWSRAVSTFCELTLAASTGSGGPFGPQPVVDDEERLVGAAPVRLAVEVARST